MKQSFEVKIVTGFTVDIPEELLTSEVAKDLGLETIDDLFPYAAQQIAQYGEHFIEGLGKAIPVNYPDNLVDALAAGLPAIRFSEGFREVESYPCVE